MSPAEGGSSPRSTRASRVPAPGGGSVRRLQRARSKRSSPFCVWTIRFEPCGPTWRRSAAPPGRPARSPWRPCRSFPLRQREGADRETPVPAAGRPSPNRCCSRRSPCPELLVEGEARRSPQNGLPLRLDGDPGRAEREDLLLGGAARARRAGWPLGPAAGAEGGGGCEAGPSGIGVRVSGERRRTKIRCDPSAGISRRSFLPARPWSQPHREATPWR